MNEVSSRPKVHLLAVIPARGGSKGVVRKNLRMLGGRPLIAHAIAAAAGSTLLTRSLVSTDDDEIARVAAAWNGVVPFRRPQELAGDTARQIDVVVHALHWAESAYRERYDWVVLLQPTSPLRMPADIDAAIRLAIESNATAVISVCEAREHPFYLYTLDGDRAVPLLQGENLHGNRQMFPRVYRRNGAVYVVRRDVLVEEHSMYGADVRAYVMPVERSINIDSESDLQLAEHLLGTSQDAV